MLRRVLKRLAAWAIPAGVRPHYLWIPSEFMPADGPSRGMGIGEKPDSEKQPRPRVVAPPRLNSHHRNLVRLLNLRKGNFLELFPVSGRIVEEFWLWSSLVGSSQSLAFSPQAAPSLFLDP